MPSTDQPLPGQWDNLEAAVRGFEAAWHQGQSPRIDDFLPANTRCRELLIELVHADLEIRLKQGEPVRIESYLQRYPELAEPEACKDLVAAEFVLRRRQNPQLDAGEYRQRFPQLGEELVSQLERADPNPLPAIPGYRILGLLSRGGMGAVFRARQLRLDRAVAIKVLLPEAANQPGFVDRFQREAQALGRLNHPHIIGVHDFGQAGQGCYLVMELVEGDSLRQRLKAGQIETAEAIRIARSVCEALEFAHEAGIVHRDIKPENILIDHKGWVKVADFGLAKLLGTLAPQSALTASHHLLGTWAYMAPEQLYQPQQADHRADIYSLGVVLYEMLTGELPIGRSPPLRSSLDDVLGKMLAKDPAERFATVAELKTALAAIEGQVSIETTKPPLSGLNTRFGLAIGGMFAVAWALTGALANLGLVGLCLAGLVMLSLAGAGVHLAIRRVPPLAAEWQRRGPALGLWSCLLATFLFLLGFAALIAAHFMIWDRHVMNPEDLARGRTGAEQRLLQQLPSLQESPERLELIGHEAKLSQEAEAGWAAWLGFCGVLLVPMAFLTILETRALRNRWAGHWQPVVILSAAMLLALPVTHAAALLTGELLQAPAKGGLKLSSRKIQLPPRQMKVSARFSETANRLSRWAHEQDYVIETRAVWSVDRATDRQTLAWLLWIEGRPRSIFDRWRITLLGPERTSPLLMIQCLGRPDAPESFVQIDLGLIREGSGLEQKWAPLLDSLEQVLTQPAD